MFEHVGEPFPGQLQYMGSCRDGSKIQGVNEIDTLYVMPDSHVLIKSTEETGFYRVCLKDPCHTELTPREMAKRFANELDGVLAAHQLPSCLTNAGYASPRYSGVRFNGPAVTSQFLLCDDADLNTILSWDATLAFPLTGKIHQQVTDMILPIVKEFKNLKDSNKRYPHWELHLVPDIVRNLWQVSSALMEAEILHRLPKETATKKALSCCKILAHRLQQWNKTHLYPSLCKTVLGQSNRSPSNINLMKKLSEYRRQLKREDSTRREKLENDLNSRMRCAHIWISTYKRRQYKEVEKDVISINTAAVKHIILRQGLSTPGAFSPDTTGDLTRKLIRNVYIILADTSQHDSPHAFLDEVSIASRIGHFSTLPTSLEETSKLYGQIQWQCQMLCDNALSEVGKGPN